MNVRPPKSFSQLPKREQENIKKLITDTVTQEVLKREAELQKIWLKMACIVLNTAYGFGEKRLLLFLGNWRTMYKKNSRFKNEAEQTEYLTKEITRLFGENGYPTAFVDKMEDL